MSSTISSRPLFPFAAVTGHERLKLALILAALDTRLGGVLVSGPRGTAKSTLARSLAELLPFSRSSLVTLPLGADEAQLTGTLDLGQALGNHEIAFQPGLLARAHEGVLYIDEVNLLPDALVDLLLDVAASGINHVERDGISHQHPADFLLIGTMNPDEGELRPQLLDRFGLAVLDHPAPDIEQRLQIVERRLAFDHDPNAFMTAWQEHQTLLRKRLTAARERLPRLTLSSELARVIATRCVQAGVEGVRADLAWRRGALAHAAWHGRDTVTREDIEALAPLVMAHRVPEWTADDTSEDGSGGHDDGNDNGNRHGETSGKHSGDGNASRYQGRRQPPEAPGRSDLAPHPSYRDTSAACAPPQRASSSPRASANSGDRHAPDDAPDDSGNDNSDGDWGNLPAHPSSLTLTAATGWHVQLPDSRVGPRTRQETARMKGRHAIGRQRVNWPSSLRGTALPHGRRSLDSPQSLAWQRERCRPDRLTCIVLDTSGSSLNRSSGKRTRQLEKAMALVERLASDAYLAREQLMLLTLSGEGLAEVLTPRRAPRTIAPLLEKLTPGGGTPLRRGLDDTRQRLTHLKRQKPDVTIRLWILTDARSRDNLELAPFACETHLVDCEPAGEALGRARELTAALEAVCHRLDDLTDSEITPASPSRITTSPGRTP